MAYWSWELCVIIFMFICAGNAIFDIDDLGAMMCYFKIIYESKSGSYYVLPYSYISSPIVFVLIMMHKVNSRNVLKEDPQTHEASVRKTADTLESNNSASGSNASMDEWRRAISAPTRYRVGSASINLRPRDVLQILTVCFVAFVIVILIYSSYRHKSVLSTESRVISIATTINYNDRYPLTKPILINGGKKFRIAVITDLDHASKVKESLWQSHYLKGYLSVYDDGRFYVKFEDQSVELLSKLGEG